MRAMPVQIYLVGTAHVSRCSAAEVKELINIVKPSTVMVELCRKRADKLRSNSQVPAPDVYATWCERAHYVAEGRHNIHMESMRPRDSYMLEHFHAGSRGGFPEESSARHLETAGRRQ